MIVPPKYIEEVGEEAFDLKPVGTGPFEVADYTPTVGRQTCEIRQLLEWRSQGLMLSIFASSQKTQRASRSCLSGGIDIALNIPKPSVDTIRENDRVDLVAVGGPTVVISRFNTETGITTDPRVRRAIALAIDTNAIIDSLLGGLASPISSAQGEKILW